MDLLILDDFAIDVVDATESRDLYDLVLKRYRAGSIIRTSNRGPDEWLATFADPVRALGGRLRSRGAGTRMAASAPS